MNRQSLTRTTLLLVVFTAAQAAQAGTLIDFDELATDATSGQSTYASDTYIDSCVTITSTRTDVPAENIGQILAVNSYVEEFVVSTDTLGPAAISTPNYVLPTPGRYDILLTFTDPVSYVALTTDQFNEGPDTVRLVGLTPQDDPEHERCRVRNYGTRRWFGQRDLRARQPARTQLGIGIHPRAVSNWFYER